MARIREYEQGTTTPDPQRSPEPRMRPAEVVNPLDLRGWQEVSRLSASALDRSREEQAKAWSADAIANGRLKWTQELIARQEQAEPGAPDFVAKYVKDFDTYANETLKSAPTEHARRFLQQRLTAIRDDLGERALMFEAKARTDFKTDSFTKAGDTAAKLMNTDPTAYGTVLAEQRALIEASDLAPVTKSALLQSVTDKIANAAVWSQIQKSPEGFLQSINFGMASAGTPTRKSSGGLQGETGNAAFDALPFERRVQMFDQAIRAKAQIDVDLDRLAKGERERIQSDKMKEIHQLNADKQLKRWHIEQARPVLSAEQYASALKMMEQPDGGVRSQPDAYRHLQQLLTSNRFDEASSMAFTYHKNKQLSDDHLNQIANAARTQGRQEGPKTEYERSYRYISQSLQVSPLVNDPDGRSRLADALDMYERWYIKGPGEGKQWSDADVEKRGKEIVGQFRMLNISETAIRLPLPRVGGINRSGSVHEWKIEIQVAAAATKALKDKGEISADEYKQEMAILNSWRKLAEGKAK